jgi:predicted GH43/DUF377 family glycosyl hydrolase
MWIKKGNIFNKHHAQVPVIDEYDTFYRIYYSTRIEGKSNPMFIDVDKQNPSKIIRESQSPILNLGHRGSFDWAGIMPTEIKTVNGIKYLYYIGWSLRQDVPYHNNLGLAISNDNGETWEKYSKGPILSTSHLEPGYIGTVSILIEENIWRMWYLSCLDWVESDLGMEPTYDIKYAESNDGINWSPKGITCIPLDGDEGGISSQRVLKINDTYHMWYSIRNKIDYRINPINTYRIKKSVSNDGINWIKNNQNELDIDFDSNWDNIMVCYPFIVKENDKLIMFYNGNGFGKTGIGYSVNESIG